MRISVIICTYNQRPEIIGECLLSLTRQHHTDYEVIVVDNNPTPSGTVKYLAKQFKFIYMRENKLGISHARNKGLSKVTGSLIVFLDDDTTVNPKYLQHVEHGAKTSKMHAGGGRVTLKYESPKPKWLEQNHPYLSSFEHGDLPLVIHAADHSPIGANMFFTKKIASTLKFDPELGRVGDSLMSGEETQIFRNLFNKEKTIVYLPKASAQHFVKKERLTISWLLRRHFYEGRTNYILGNLTLGKPSGHHTLIQRIVWFILFGARITGHIYQFGISAKKEIGRPLKF